MMLDIDEPMGVGGADDAMVATAAPVGAVAAFCDGAKSFVDMVWRLWDFGTEQPLATPAQLFSCSPVDGRGRGTDMDGQWADGRGTDVDGLGTGVDGRGRGTDVDRRGRTGRTWTDGRGRGWTAYFDSRWVRCQARQPSTPTP